MTTTHLDPAVDGTRGTISTRARTRPAAAVATGLFAGIMTLSGILYLIGPRALMQGLLALGYPAYFLKLLGGAKLLGVVGILLPRRPRLREWAYAGFTFDLVAAAISHGLTGTPSHAVPPLALLALMTVSYLPRREPPVMPRSSGAAA